MVLLSNQLFCRVQLLPLLILQHPDPEHIVVHPIETGRTYAHGLWIFLQKILCHHAHILGRIPLVSEAVELEAVGQVPDELNIPFQANVRAKSTRTTAAIVVISLGCIIQLVPPKTHSHNGLRHRQGFAYLH